MQLARDNPRPRGLARRARPGIERWAQRESPVGLVSKARALDQDWLVLRSLSQEATPLALRVVQLREQQELVQAEAGMSPEEVPEPVDTGTRAPLAVELPSRLRAYVQLARPHVGREFRNFRSCCHRKSGHGN